MTEKVSEQEIREKLAKHYGGNNQSRELVKNERKDDYGKVGSIVYSLSGSPPKGYAIVIPELAEVSLYDHTGKRFRRMDHHRVVELES